MEKFKDKFTEDPVDTCRGLKIMLHSLHKAKDVQQQVTSCVILLVPQIFSNLQPSLSSLLVSTQLDLLGTLLDLKLLP